jgi:hypothetical protein
VADQDLPGHDLPGPDTSGADDSPTASTEGTETMQTDVVTTPDPAPPAEPTRHRRGPDPLALLVGLATLAMAVFAFVGDLPDLSGFDPRWLLAGGAAVVGLVLLVGSLRGRSRGPRGG